MISIWIVTFIVAFNFFSAYFAGQRQSSGQSGGTTYQFVGSVNSDVYHYPSCTYAQRIKSENQVWFTSSADARAHGYRPCSVCNPP